MTLIGEAFAHAAHASQLGSCTCTVHVTSIYKVHTCLSGLSNYIVHKCTCMYTYMYVLYMYGTCIYIVLILYLSIETCKQVLSDDSRGGCWYWHRPARWACSAMGGWVSATVSRCYSHWMSCDSGALLKVEVSTQVCICGSPWLLMVLSIVSNACTCMYIYLFIYIFFLFHMYLKPTCTCTCLHLAAGCNNC